MLAVPEVTPVTIPEAASTLAVAADDVDHTPPDGVPVHVTDEPLHTLDAPVITGSAFTKMEAVEEHPP